MGRLVPYLTVHDGAAAIAAGATVDREPTRAEDGGLRGWFVDPFGHRWGVSSAPA